MSETSQELSLKQGFLVKDKYFFIGVLLSRLQLKEKERKFAMNVEESCFKMSTDVRQIWPRLDLMTRAAAFLQKR